MKMMQLLTPKFLINQCVDAEELKTNFRINFSRFKLADYYKIKTEQTIDYYFYNTPYGEILVASTEQAICYLHFVQHQEQALKEFKLFFPDCNWQHIKSKQHQIALKIINENEWPEMLNLQVKGTDFQYKVWRALTKIELGKITTYSELAKNMGMEGSSRAVGSAIGMNEIAYLIPCHRVIQKTGKLAGFRWGEDLKSKLLKVELIGIE